MFCPHCGVQLKEGAKFCENCGGKIEAAPQPQPAAYGGWPRVAPGYSRMIDSEEVIRALNKQQRAGSIATAVIVPLPLIGFLIYGAVSDNMSMSQALAGGLIITAIFALSALIVTVKKKLAKPFEGTVAVKKTRIRVGNAGQRGGRIRTKYLVWFDCEDGKRRKKEVSLYAYDYLQEGDRVRYLPRFPQPFEKYDKSRDGDIMCMFCGRLQDIGQDTCSFCHNPLIK